MSEPNRIEANFQIFNEHVRRTSERLADRTGSAPPEDRSTVEMPDLPTINPGPTVLRPTATTRGRGRGRGKKSTINTRASAAARSLAAATANNAAVTTNDAVDQQDSTSNLINSTDDSAITSGNPPAMQNNEVDQPTILIERDTVNPVTRKRQ